MLLMLDFLVSGSRNTLYTVSHSVVSDSLRPHGLYPWDSPGQNTGVGSLSLLQGIFPTQGSNPGLRHCRHILYQLSYWKPEVILRPPNRDFRLAGIDLERDLIRKGEVCPTTKYHVFPCGRWRIKKVQVTK